MKGHYPRLAESEWIDSGHKKGQKCALGRAGARGRAHKWVKTCPAECWDRNQCRVEADAGADTDADTDAGTDTNANAGAEANADTGAGAGA